jgi:hypothetical protein
MVLKDKHGKNAWDEELLASARSEADLAEREIASGFPLLHEQAIVSLWAWTESMVKSLLTAWLLNRPEAYSLAQIQRLRVSIGDYEPLDREERSFFIIELLDRELNAPLKQGCTRFESLLTPFGLSGPVQEKLARDMFELNQVRNLIVHRGGIVDRRFRANCPWLGLRLGDRFLVTQKNSAAYFESVLLYHKTIRDRLDEFFCIEQGSKTPGNADSSSGTA